MKFDFLGLRWPSVKASGVLVVFFSIMISAQSAFAVDLAVQTLLWNPFTMSVGDHPTSTSVQVKSYGGDYNSKVIFYYWLSSDTTLSKSTDKTIGNITINYPGYTSSWKTQSFSSTGLSYVTIPDNFVCGTYYLFVEAVPDGGDSDPNDNVAQCYGQVTVTGCPVDLGIRNLQLTTTMERGDYPASLSYEIRSFTTTYTGGATEQLYLGSNLIGTHQYDSNSPGITTSWTTKNMGQNIRDNFVVPTSIACGQYQSRYVITVSGDQDTSDNTVNGPTVTITGCCDSHEYVECWDGDVYWYDSCDVREEKAEDCGLSGNSGSPYCTDDDLYQDYVTRGCSNGACTSSTEANRIEDCGSSGLTGSSYCYDDDVYRDYATRGCSSGSCTESIARQKQNECGISGFSGSAYCDGGDVYRDYLTKGCSSGACTQSEQAQLQESCGTSGYEGTNYCSGGDVFRDYVTKGCSGGTCTESSEKELQEDCLASGYDGEEYCFDGDVYRDYINRTCTSGACDESTDERLQTSCDDRGCSAGVCNPPEEPDCTSGDCCDTASGVFRSSSYVCDDEVDEEFRCSGSACGSDAQRRVLARHCSGSSSDCEGSESWGQWTTIEECSQDQACDSGDSYAQCQDCSNGCGDESAGECNAVGCSSGECCDSASGTVYGSEHVCAAATDSDVEYRCVGDEECGQTLEVRTAQRVCDGNSSNCPAAKTLTDWEQVDICGSTESCSAASGKCVTSSSCGGSNGEGEGTDGGGCQSSSGGVTWVFFLFLVAAFARKRLFRKA